jgi:hypothetical protein
VHVALAVVGMVFYLAGLLEAGFYLSHKSAEDEPTIRPKDFWRYELDARLGLLVIMMSGLQHWPPMAIAAGSVGMAVLEASILYFGWITHRATWPQPLPWARIAQAVAVMGVGFGLTYLGLAI